MGDKDKEKETKSTVPFMMMGYNPHTNDISRTVPEGVDPNEWQMYMQFKQMRQSGTQDFGLQMTGYSPKPFGFREGGGFQGGFRGRGGFQNPKWNPSFQQQNWVPKPQFQSASGGFCGGHGHGGFCGRGQGGQGQGKPQGQNWQNSGQAREQGQNQNKPKRETCKYCQKQGHNAANCYKLSNDVSKFRQNPQQQATPQAMMNQAVNNNSICLNNS